MKKRFLILLFGVLISVVFFCCSHKKSSEKPTAELDAAPTVSPENWQKFSQENFVLAVPDGSWQEVDHSVDEIKVALKEVDKECLILFAKENTTDTLPAFTADTLRVLTDNGAKIYAVYQQSINGNKFVLTQMTRKYEVIWFWIAVKDGFGYSFACANEYNPDAGLEANRDFCQSIANTIQIN